MRKHLVDILQLGALALFVSGVGVVAGAVFGLVIGLGSAALAAGPVLWVVGRELSAAEADERKRWEKLTRNQVARHYVAENPNVPLSDVEAWLGESDD